MLSNIVYYIIKFKVTFLSNQYIIEFKEMFLAQ